MDEEPLKPPEPKRKSNRGGPRLGSGRKPKEAKVLKRQVDSAIAGRLDQILRNLFNLADGVRVLGDEEDDEGKPVVFIAPPDRAANIYLLDRLLGKSSQAINFNNLSDDDLVALVEGRLGGNGLSRPDAPPPGRD